MIHYPLECPICGAEFDESDSDLVEQYECLQENGQCLLCVEQDNDAEADDGWPD